MVCAWRACSKQGCQVQAACSQQLLSCADAGCMRQASQVAKFLCACARGMLSQSRVPSFAVPALTSSRLPCVQPPAAVYALAGRQLHRMRWIFCCASVACMLALRVTPWLQPALAARCIACNHISQYQCRMRSCDVTGGFCQVTGFFGYCEPHRNMHDAVQWRSLFCLYFLRIVRAVAVLQCALLAVWGG